ncbi:MAG: PQQ-binding-like beta-propeller repeat protein [Thermoguttaceae bacterium]|jgi:outer membrane protein assembly factor BamB
MTTRHLFASILCLALWTPIVRAADWPCYLGANRDNTSADENLKLWSGDSPKVLWKKNVGSGHSCMSVAGKRLYTQGAGRVWCLDAETGELVWRWPPSAKGDETTATPTVADGLVFALNADQTLVCLDAADGKLQWSQKVDDFGVKKGGWALSCSPLVMGNRVIMDLGVVFLLDKATGKLVWKAGSDTAGYASAVVFGPARRKLITSFNGTGLTIYSPARSQSVAQYPWQTSYGVNAATPIVSGDKIFISSGYGRGCTLLKLAGGALEKVWENKEMNNHCQTCVLAGGFLYGVHGQQGGKGSLKCLALASGRVKWDEKGLPVGGGLTLADGKLFVMLDGGTLLVAEAAPKAFHELARAKLFDGQCWTMPIVANGCVFCRNHHGELVCLDLR